MYTLLLTRNAEKEYKKLQPAIAERIAFVIFGSLRENPFSRYLDIKKLKVPLDGFRLRIGDYRVIYDVDGEFIKIYSIRHRKDAYR